MDGVFTHHRIDLMCENSRCPSGYSSSRLYNGGWWPSWVFKSPHNMSRGSNSFPKNVQSRAGMRGMPATISLLSALSSVLQPSAELAIPYLGFIFDRYSAIDLVHLEDGL